MNPILARLDGLCRENRIAPAMGFQGSDEAALCTAALRIAHHLLCERERDQRPCGSCSTCARVDSRNHPDFFVVEADKREIKIDQVRQLQRWLSVAPFERTHKVAWIAHADDLNLAAANALLKTLEEPQPHSVVLLTCRTLAGLPITLVSRLQVVRFPSETDSALSNEPEEGWERSLTDLLSRPAFVPPDRIFALAETIGRKESSLRTAFGIIERHLLERARSAPTQRQARSVDHLYDLTRTMEREALNGYGNAALCLERILLEHRTRMDL